LSDVQEIERIGNTLFSSLLDADHGDDKLVPELSRLNCNKGLPIKAAGRLFRVRLLFIQIRYVKRFRVAYRPGHKQWKIVTIVIMFNVPANIIADGT